VTDWDEQHPGRGDTAGMDALIARVLEHVHTLDQSADELRAVTERLTSTWRGAGADAWAVENTGAEGELRAFRQQLYDGLDVANQYNEAVRLIAARTVTIEGDLDQARYAESMAQAALDELRALDDPDSWEVSRARSRVDLAQEDAVYATRQLAQLVFERQQADTYLTSSLGAGLPTGWGGGGGFGALTAALPAVAFSRGPEGLAVWIAGLPDGAEGDAALRWLVENLSDAQFEALLAAHPEVASRLMGGPDGAFAERFPALATALDVGGPDARIAAVIDACAGLSAHDLVVIARCYPGVVGNLDGVPLTTRIAANRVAISADLAASRAGLAAMEDLLAEEPGEPAPMQLTLLAGFRASVARCEDLLYGEVAVVGNGGGFTTGRHQVVVFDAAAGRFGELVGDPAAPNIAVVLGGTGTGVSNMSGQYDRALDLVAGVPEHSLAIITYLGGSMPPTLDMATRSRYAMDIAPHLASFANGVKAVTGATITVAGHSYGGSVVGRAEVEGMVVDRILHIESAGSGPGVDSVQDYAAPETPRYSMTAPGDPIGMIQGLSAGGTDLGHGMDPDILDGVVRLETGRVNARDPHSPVLSGSDAHSGVFGDDTKRNVKPDAWDNILAVMTGGEVTVWTAPTVESTVPWDVEVTYPMSDPTFVPPTQVVR